MTLNIGTISHGTLVPSDLAQAIYDTLKSEGYETSHILMRELLGIAQGTLEDDDSGIINDGIDALQEYAPEFCYVGMHEGDGSDLGCWPDIDAIQDAVHDGYAIAISDLSDLDSLSVSTLVSASYAVSINDHGNITVYALHVGVKPIWDCV